MSAGEPIHRSDFNHEEDIDTEDPEESQYKNVTLYDQVYEIAEKCAGTSVGQYLTGKIDRFLKIIEDTAKWSLPPKNRNESTTTLKRTLPWIPFITLILLLRLVRISLSIGGLFIGNDPISPSDVVYFIQTRRRKLRAIRIAGMKEIVNKEQTHENKQRGGLLSNLSAIMSMAICRPKLSEDSDKVIVTENNIEEAEAGSKKIQQNHNSSKNQCFEDENACLNISQMLDKYGASSNEDDDSDFIPPNDSLNDADTSTTSTATSDEDKNNEKENKSDRNEHSQSNCNNTLESKSNASITNGNISIDSQELNTDVKENGEHLSTKLRKPKIMPKPIKDEPLPLPIPIQIKQEPTDSDEDILRSRSEHANPEDLNKSNDFDIHQQQKSIVAPEFTHKAANSDMKIAENGKEQFEKTNGDQKAVETEIFVTPATSAEDLFFSPVGSPDLCGAYGFQPASILKNCQKGFTDVGAFASSVDFIQGESTNESETTSRSTKSASHRGKPIKNKFRGKRR